MRVSNARVHLGIKKASFRSQLGADLSAAPPNRSREPWIALTKLEDSACTAKMGRSGLRGIRLRLDTSVNTENSRNKLRGKLMGRAPQKPCTTDPGTRRDPSSEGLRQVFNAEEPTSRRRRHTGQLHGDIDRAGRSCMSDHD